MNNTLVCIDVYTVSAGDTLYTIAERYDLPVSLLMKVNCISNPYNLQIGTKLCIPGDESQIVRPPSGGSSGQMPTPPQSPGPSAPPSGSPGGQMPTPPANPRPPVIAVPLPMPMPSPAPCPPARRMHIVEAGDTLYLIARKHGIRLDDMMNANPDIDPYNLMIGTELYIPM